MNDLYNRIFDAGCIKFGEFKLKSGIMSPVYCDFRGLVSKPRLLEEIGQALGERAKQIGYGAAEIGWRGFLMRGCRWGSRRAWRRGFR